METAARALSLPKSTEQPSMPLHYAINLLVAIVWGVLVYYFWPDWRASGFSWKTVLFAAVTVRNSSFAILFLTRRPAKASSRQLKDWTVSFLGTFLGFFYDGNESYSLFSPECQPIIDVILILAIILSISAVLTLGRSFGIVPANRGIKTTGLYRFVRHPIYSCYLIFDIFFITLRFSWFNTLISVIFFAATYLRATYEENLLNQDPVYRAYTRQTPYMFFPGLL